MSTPSAKYATAFTPSQDAPGVQAVTTVLNLREGIFILGAPNVTTLMRLVELMKAHGIVPQDMDVDPARYQAVKIGPRKETAHETEMKHAYRLYREE